MNAQSALVMDVRWSGVRDTVWAAAVPCMDVGTSYQHASTDRDTVRTSAIQGVDERTSGGCGHGATVWPAAVQGMDQW